jgi:hypothetical protein
MATDNIIESAVGDIHVPNKGLKNTPVDTSFEFIPQNPFTIDIPSKTGEANETVANPGYLIEPEKIGIIKTAIDEFQKLATVSHVLHAANAPLTKPASAQVAQYYPDVNDKFYHPAPPGWSPKQEIEKQTNIDPKYLPKLMATKNPDDFRYTMDSINDETVRDKELENGSTLGKILGGFLGLTVGSPENFIPLTAIATKAKVGAGFIEGALKNGLGLSVAAAIHEGAAQIDKIDGNLPSFLKDTFIDTVFGMAFYGGFGAAKSLVNVVEFNNLKKFARESLDGIGFNYKVDKEGNLKGFEAIDTTGGYALNAARVTRAQELADAAFFKGPIFKIPYLGTAVLKTITGNFSNDIPGFRTIGKGLEYLLGSPLIKLKTSDYPEANAFADAAFDHFITTEGEAKGGVRPKSFEKKVKETRAMLTALKAQTKSLHAERNGYTITARPAIDIQNAWNASKQKSIEALSQDSKSTDWTSEEGFMDEIQHVLFTDKSSEHAAVNTGAAIYRKIIDNTWANYRKAYNLPKEWMPPKTAEAYLMRIYNTDFMNANENLWMEVVSKWIGDSDKLITQKMKPIHDINELLEQHKINHENLIRGINKTDKQVSESAEKLISLKAQKKGLEEKLQNELRENPELNIHVDDSSALSAKEANDLNQLTKRRDIAFKELKEQKKFIADMKNKISKSKSNANKAKTVATGKKQIRKSDIGEMALEKEEEKLRILDNEHEEEIQKIHEAIANGQVNPRLFYREPESNTFKLRDSTNRLKFRDIHESDFHIRQVAKSTFDSIMHMHPEDVISDIFGKLMGNPEANPLKKRTLMIPDEILYNNNFMTKDLFAKTANYVNYLSKKTHLKTSFENVTVNGDFKELAEGISNRYQSRRAIINKKLEKITDPKEIIKQQKLLKKEDIKFKDIKNTMQQLFETRMMGINKRNDFDTMFRRTLMSLTASVNLHNMPATQITDLAFAGFQHGIWPSIRDGIYPIIESLGGILKTKDAEALREMAPHINLGLQDMLNNYADKNWGSDLQPYLNMGKIMSGIEKYAHFSALTDLSPYIDNGIQRMNGSIIQSHFMELLHKEVKGILSDKDSLYLRKYGIDPKIWASRMVNAYKESKGFKTKLGGHLSKSWLWQDLEAANIFNDAVFRGIQNTSVSRGMADSPFFADKIYGMFFHTFTGWTYAATNRYLIPALQHADGEMLLKMMWVMGAGALVSPTRRISRGEDGWPDDMTPVQHAYEAFTDSGVMSSISNVLNIANLMSDDKLLGDLKNDKFKNRVKTGIFGMSDVVSSTAARITDVIGMFNSGIDEKDMKTAAHMTCISGAMYGRYFSDKLIEGQNWPKNKKAAENN